MRPDIAITHNPREEDMTRKSTALFAVAAMLGGLAAATAFAQDRTPPSQPPQPQGMMGGQGGMMNMMGQMNPDQMKQMARMIENCNRMMESMSNPPTGPDREQAPGTHG
jgi:hypothetical protein